MRNTILRALLFVGFFSLGAAALGGSILCDELLVYYRSGRLLKTAEESLSRLESLNSDYDALLAQLEKEPDFADRIGHATLGREPADADTVYPKVTPGQLAAARAALAEESKQQSAEPPVPDWLDRCSKPLRRLILFFAGAFLILISFICFGPAGQTAKKE